MKVLVFTTLYPNNVAPNHGVFIRERVHHFAKLDGCEVARRIREEEWGKEILLAAVTGWGQESDRRRTKEPGFDVHLTKPVDPAALEKLLTELLPAPAAA